MSYDFGLYECSGNSSSSENDDPEASVSHKTKNSVTDEQKNKLKLLVQKRVQLQKNYKQKIENKSLKKLKTNKQEATSSAGSEGTVTNESFKNKIKQFDEDLEKKKIDEALQNDNIERAITLSDELSVKKAEDLVFKAAEAVKFKQSQEKKRLRSKANKRAIEWRFEPKKKWEAKSNM